MDLRRDIDEQRCHAGVAQSCREALLAPGSPTRGLHLYLEACVHGAADACDSVARALETSATGLAPLGVEDALAASDALTARAQSLRASHDQALTRDVDHLAPSPPGPALPAPLVRLRSLQAGQTGRDSGSSR